MSQASQNIAQQFIDGGVVPTQLVGQNAVSKTYVEGQLTIRDQNISAVAGSVGQTQLELDQLENRVDRIVASAGDSNTEIVDARGGYPLLDARLNASDEQLSETVKKGELFFNVKDYGAKGDGVTDDINSIRDAIDACPAGGMVWFPPTSAFYLCKGQWNITKNITISSANATDDQNGGSIATRVLFKANTANPFTTAVVIEASGVKIENIMFHNGDTIQSGIVASEKMNITLDRLWFRAFEYPIKFNDCIQCNFRQVNVRDCVIGFRFERQTLGGTSMSLENCWVQNPSLAGYRFIGQMYCTLVNCLMDGLLGFEPLNGFIIESCGTISLINCAGERAKESMYVISSSDTILMNNCISIEGNKSTTGLSSYAHLKTSGSNIAFIGCKDMNPLGTSTSIIKGAGVGTPVMIACAFPKGYNHEGAVLAVVPSNSVNVGFASLQMDNIVIISPSGTRKKITVSDANVITAVNA